jgi:uncharacterized protein YigA (DUF484 family)
MGVTPEQVEDFLRAHPDFLAEAPGRYRGLAPPVRVHGDVLADHMAALLQAEREHARAMADRADGVLAAGRAAAGLLQRVQEAVLALLGAGEDVAECVGAEFPALLAVDAATLCVEGGAQGCRTLPAGAVAALLGLRAVVFRAGFAEAALHGEAVRLAAHEALVRIPGAGAPALLALAARGGATLDPAQGSGALAFLGRALAVSLGR